MARPADHAADAAGNGKPLIALISGHRDGQIISKVGAIFGIQTAVGSSSKGGMRAAREMMRLARDGHSLFVTPDGPRGPRMQHQQRRHSAISPG